MCELGKDNRLKWLREGIISCVGIIYLFRKREVSADLEDTKGGRGSAEESKELVARLSLKTSAGALPLEVS